jgi:Zn-dependent alcohol dehydrogenase
MASGARVRGIREGDHVMLSFMPRPLPGGVRPELPAVKVRGQELRVSGASSTWSDDVVVDQAFVVPMDPHVPTDVTAVIGCAVTTGCGAVINTARVRPGDSVVSSAPEESDCARFRPRPTSAQDPSSPST